GDQVRTGFRGVRVQGGLGAGDLLHPARHQRHRRTGHRNAQHPPRHGAAPASALAAPASPAPPGPLPPAGRGVIPTAGVLIRARDVGPLAGLALPVTGPALVAGRLPARAPALACLLVLGLAPRTLE